MKTGEMVTVKVTREIKTTGGVNLLPGSYSGIYSEDGGVIHESGDVYRVYRIPCVVVDNGGCSFKLTYLDSEDIPSTPKKLISEKKFLGYVGAQPVYDDLP